MTPPWLTPFAFGSRDNLDALDLRPLGVPLRAIDALSADATRFHALLHRMNAVAFGGMGMPLWVQLDCGVLPSAFIGFAAPPSRLPAPLREALGVRDDDDLVPVAEALAVPTAKAGQWMSVSLASVLPGYGLGARAKALSLASTRAEISLGITQYDNPAVRTHLQLGSLRVRVPRVAAHDKPQHTFLYELRRDAPWRERVGPIALPPPTTWVQTDDLAALCRIEADAEVVAWEPGQVGLIAPRAR